MQKLLEYRYAILSSNIQTIKCVYYIKHFSDTTTGTQLVIMSLHQTIQNCKYFVAFWSIDVVGNSKSVHDWFLLITTLGPFNDRYYLN